MTTQYAVRWWSSAGEAYRTVHSFMAESEHAALTEARKYVAERLNEAEGPRWPRLVIRPGRVTERIVTHFRVGR